MLLVYNCVLLKMSTWGSKHVEESNILPINNRVLPIAAYQQATRNSYREWRYHMLLMYNCVLLKMSTWGSKHLEEGNILPINNRVLPIAAYQQATRNSYREWRYHMLLVYNYVLLKMSTWCSKHVEESNILPINNRVLPIAAYQQATRNSYREWQYHMLLVYNYVLLKMSIWCSKHVEESNILPINNRVLPIAAYQQATRNSYREWRYHMLLMYDYVLLKMSTWCSKHVEESNNIWRINNIQYITLVVLYGQFMMHGQRNIKSIHNYWLNWKRSE